MIVACPIAAAAQSWPDREAVVDGSGSLTYLELDHAVVAAVDHFKRLGVARGDRIGLRLDAGLDFPLILFALFRLGAVAVLLSTRDPEATVLAGVRATGCRFLVTDSRCESPVPALYPDDFRNVGKEAIGERLDLLDLDSTATVIFTSGSEANPKAVVHSLKNHWFSALGSQEVIPVSALTRWAVVIPSYHVGGLSIFFRCFVNGGTVVIPPRNERVPTGLTSYRISHISVVPTQLSDWMRRDDASHLLNLDTILVGGAATPGRLRSEAIARGFPVRFSYGSTEMASQIATTDRDATDATPGDVGRILPYRQVRVEEGEIFVRGETRFAGYWTDGSLLIPFDGAGWFATGDAGAIDGDRLTVTGRRDNQFISGGENIHPEEIEEAIIAAGLADVAIVVPVADPRFGARPLAFVRPLCSVDELRSGLLPVLAAFKIPVRVLPLPDHMVGSKRDRRALLAEGAGLAEPS